MSFLRSSLLLTALAWGIAAPVGAAPIYFGGVGGVGFADDDPAVIAEGIDIVLDGSYTFVSAGNPSLFPVLEVTTALVGQPTVPSVISAGTPITALVEYTVTNTTGSVLDDEHVAFTYSGTLALYPELTSDEFGIDVPGLVLLEQATCSADPVGPCVFGAVALPVMAAGAVHQFQITHVMADTLSGSLIIPTPSLAMLEHTAVPEPAAALLLAMGLAATLRTRRG